MAKIDIGKIIRKRREELGLTQDQVAISAGLSKPYLSNIETGRAKNPPTDKVLYSLERALGFEAGQLTKLAHWARTPEDVRIDHERLIRQLDRLRGVVGQLFTEPKPETTEGAPASEASVKFLKEFAHGMEMDEGDANVRMVQISRSVPIINKAAGYPQTTDLDHPASVADDYVRCPDVHDPQAFAARVVGDSMEPRYRQDDIVIFSPAIQPQNGDDCFVRFAGDAATTFKRYYQDSPDTIRLQPLNNAYPAEVFARNQITGLWPAVFRLEKLRR